MSTPHPLLLGAVVGIATICGAANVSERNPAEELPRSIQQLTHFGERADWSHDGRKILFLEKTFGDVYEVDVATGVIRLLTAHYAHHGYTRALYLSNGDILLSGPTRLDPLNRGDARIQCELFVLDRAGRTGHEVLRGSCSFATTPAPRLDSRERAVPRSDAAGLIAHAGS